MLGDGGDRVFSEHQSVAQSIFAQQTAARDRDIPSFLIACMPRSASASLTNSLAATFDIPTVRFSAGRFPYYVIAPNWLRQFLPGGAVSHDHFGPSRHNLQVLKDQDVKRLFVLIRDPRAAAASAIGLMKRTDPERAARETDEALIMETCLVSYFPWLQSWIDVAEDASRGIRIDWITNREIASNLPETFDRMVKAVGRSFSFKTREVRENAGAGDDDAWRARVSTGARKQLWDAMSKQMKSLLDLRE
jgi:hypothetical protein